MTDRVVRGWTEIRRRLVESGSVEPPFATFRQLSDKSLISAIYNPIWATAFRTFSLPFAPVPY